MPQVLTFQEALQRGIRPDQRSPNNAQALVECTNLRPTRFGLKDYLPINQPQNDATLASAGITREWPWPQHVRGKDVSLVFSETGVWQDIIDFGLIGITTKDADDLSEVTPGNKAISAGGPWHFMDMYSTWMAMNGACQVFKTSHRSETFVQDAVTISTGCVHKEARAMFAGFDAADFWSSDWQTFWALYDDNLPDQVSLDLSVGADSQWVWWSTIGGGDLLWLFSTTLMTYGSLDSTDVTGFGPDNPFFFELLKRNELGLRPMPWQGQVYRMIPLGDYVVVYGDNGIAALRSHSSPYATMGYLPLNLAGLGLNVGIASRSAAGGWDLGHVFIDTSGELWRVDTDMNAIRLGYGEIFTNMLGNDIVISFDPHRKEFWIADDNEAYVLSETGLGKAPERPTTVSFYDGGLLGYRFDASETDAVTLETETFNFGVPGKVGSLESVSLVGTDTDSTGWSVSIKYRLARGDAFTTTTPVALDGRSMALLKQSGLEGRVVLTHPDRTKCDLDQLTVEIGLPGEVKRSFDSWEKP